MKYEIRIDTSLYIGNVADKEMYKDNLILALARFAYAPYFTEDENVCFTMYSDKDLTKVKEDLENKKVQEQIL